MSFRDLLEWPVWEGSEVGLSLPESPHAVSVALPRWEDIVAYEENKPELLSRLQAGYPRFVIHRRVRELAKLIAPGQICLPFPSVDVAQQCADYIIKSAGTEAKVALRRTMQGVTTTPAGERALRQFWMHTGMIVSSRQAMAQLEGEPDLPNAYAIRKSLRKRLASFYQCDEDDIFLTPTGMAAHYTALRILNHRFPKQQTAQLGFPYVDTLKLQERIGHGAVLLHNLETIPEELSRLLERQPLAGCFCEVPGNPQLGSADLTAISPILRDRGIPLVLDDVVATPYNVNLSQHADLIATSLTKFVAGSGDVMGGALVLNHRSPSYLELKRIAENMHQELLWGEDAAVLDRHARDFPERMRRHNANGLYIAERLRQHPAIERVWYPKWESSKNYEAVRRPEGGWGALVTFLPKNAPQTAPLIYDNLEVCKGPSLGTTFSLACPFTLLAHYSELEWAERCGVSRYLIRISAGLEKPDQLWQRIERALNQVQQP